jgi:hypothetical protein
VLKAPHRTPTPMQSAARRPITLPRLKFEDLE